MFFLAGAASSVLDILGSLQDGTGIQQNGAASATTSTQSPFSIPASPADGGATAGTAATSPNPAGNAAGCLSCAETMNALLSEQGQSASGTAGAPDSMMANLFGNIEQLLNQIGASEGPAASARSLDSTQSMDGANHHRIGAIEKLLQSLDGPDGADQGADSTASLSPLLTTGTGFPLPFSWPSNAAGATASETGTPAVNPLARLMDLQARTFAAVTAGQNLSMTA